MNSGKVLICMIVAVAVLAATVAWRHQASRGDRVLELWGSENAYLIRCADEICLTADGQEIELSQAKGIAHARQALIVDSSYEWTPLGQTVGSGWDHRVRFSEEGREFELQFDLKNRVAQGSAGSPVKIGPTLAKGLKVFFDEQLSR